MQEHNTIPMKPKDRKITKKSKSIIMLIYDFGTC